MCIKAYAQAQILYHEHQGWCSGSDLFYGSSISVRHDGGSRIFVRKTLLNDQYILFVGQSRLHGACQKDIFVVVAVLT